MLRDATYTGITPQFWGSLDAVAGPEAWRLHGLTNCGKGNRVRRRTCPTALRRRASATSRWECAT